MRVLILLSLLLTGCGRIQTISKCGIPIQVFAGTDSNGNQLVFGPFAPLQGASNVVLDSSITTCAPHSGCIAESWKGDYVNQNEVNADGTLCGFQFNKVLGGGFSVNPTKESSYDMTQWQVIQ